ncbi:hypothetical protein SF1_32520 [Sphingobacterium faecium NBRC 15299]|uniref:hypothetical protein n=1 Tax=Sphingobacterium faecium TaxID=34087 RepID=UPI000D3841F8|nr:hypothetical protein [Sphingobacterium faecium]PTX13576.1 hypothetical protein C8N37_101322 [Sphingobacterium faecium]GEM65270.1 hypothetical protein SF1_32520 [Sphingobacterium faecium NBRC 15299]
MAKLTLYQILAIEVRNNESFNPFGDQFDRYQLSNNLDAIIKDKYIGDVEYDQKGAKAVSALSELNKTYESYIDQIKEILKSTGLTGPDLISRVIASTNYYYLSVLQQQKEVKDDHDKGKLEDIHNLARNEFKNMNGTGVSATDISDSVNDAANEIIKIILSLNITDEAQLPISEPKITSQLAAVLQIASIIYAMKYNFQEFQFETAEIDFSFDTITFSKSPGSYFLIKAANKIRQRNQIMEFFITANRFQKNKLIRPISTIANGQINFSRGSQPDETNMEAQILCDFLAFHFHLNLAKLNEFEEFRVNDLFKLFEYLRATFHSVDVDSIVSKATSSQDYRYIPYEIEIDHLNAFLSSESGISIELTKRFTSLLSQPLSQDMDIWAKPFIQVGNNLLFLLGAIGGHLTYQFEHLLDGFVPEHEQMKLFKNHLELELNTSKHGHTLKQVDISPVSANLSSEGLLVYQSLKHLLVFQLCLIKYPLDAITTAAEMVSLFKQVEILKSNIEVLKANIKDLTGREQVKIVGSLVTNHPLFSGMTLEDIPVLDAILLKNYIDVGKYRRGMIVMSPEQINSEDISSYPYYHDDESFDKNILSFLYQPSPVHEMVKNIRLENFKISLGEQSPLIFAQTAELQPLSESMSNLVSELLEYLKQLHYFDADYNKDPEGKRLISDRIEFLTPLTFSYFSIDKTNRESRILLLSNFKKVGFDGTVFLLNNLLKVSRQTAKKGIEILPLPELPPIDHEKADSQWRELSKSGAIQGPISPSNFSMHHNLSDVDRDNLLRHLFSLISSYGPGIYEEERLKDFYLLATITVGLAAGLKHFEKEVYSTFLNLMDTLNYNGHFQKARNFSEEALAYSFKYETVPLLGWLALFKCFSKQKNIQDAAFYGNAYFSALNALPSVKMHQAFDGFYNAMLFFRNFGFQELADNFFVSLNSMPLESYQLQQITLSFMNAKLSDVKNLQQHLVLAEDFLNKHILEITEHGQQGALPWTAFLYNLINIEKAGHIIVPASLKIYLTEFEKLLDPLTLENIHGQFFPDGKKSVILLKEALKKTYETMAVEDYVSEITALEMLANNVASLSINPLDLNNLLISGLVLNDQTLTFHELEANESKDIVSLDKVVTPDFESYGSDLLKKTPIQSGQVILWLFEFHGKVYALYIDEHLNTNLQHMPNWSIKEMRTWLGGLDDYFFDEKNSYPINQQEGDYIDDLKKLHFNKLDIPFDFTELLVCYSLELAVFPPNLLEIPIDFSKFPELIEPHEERVKEHLREQPFDFIGFQKPVTNIISIEFLSSKGIEINKSKEEISVGCWIPTIDEDMTLYIAEKTLRPIIEDKYNSTIQNSVYPQPPLNSTVNVFVAHGAKTITGFRSVHTRGQNEGHAIVNETGISRVFGTGFIAVVFICDSGSMTKDIYSQKLISFVSEILSLGYSAVVAPAWKYNPAICAIWLDTFLDSLKAGLSISFAVQKANKVSAKEGFDEYFGFYSPRGWAAMHLYGNPNIHFK